MRYKVAEMQKSGSQIEVKLEQDGFSFSRLPKEITISVEASMLEGVLGKAKEAPKADLKEEPKAKEDKKDTKKKK